MQAVRSSFLESYRPWQYSDDVKQLCIKMYLNGMGLRGIERVTDIHHTTIMGWVREAGLKLPDVPEPEEEPDITDLDERFWEESFPQNSLMNYKHLWVISGIKSGCGLR